MAGIVHQSMGLGNTKTRVGKTISTNLSETEAEACAG